MTAEWDVRIHTPGCCPCVFPLFLPFSVTQPYFQIEWPTNTEKVKIIQWRAELSHTVCSGTHSIRASRGSLLFESHMSNKYHRREPTCCLFVSHRSRFGFKFDRHRNRSRMYGVYMPYQPVVTTALGGSFGFSTFFQSTGTCLLWSLRSSVRCLSHRQYSAFGVDVHRSSGSHGWVKTPQAEGGGDSVHNAICERSANLDAL